MVKVSVIVPVYNIEEVYLRRCIESLARQTWENTEIILVDDGSPGSCPAVCDEYAQRYDRIQVIHKENAGTAAARNSGLDVATGDYICFVDGDDYIEEDALEKALTSLNNTAPDLIVFDVLAEFEDRTEHWANFKGKETMDFKETLRMFLDNDIIQSCWAKLISRKAIGNLRQNENLHRGQDTEFIIRILLQQGVAFFSPLPLYHYIIRENSATNMTFTPKVFCISEMSDLVKEEVLAVYPEFKRQTDSYSANGLWLMIHQYKRSSDVKPEYTARIRKILRERKDCIYHGKLPLRQKTVLLLFCYFGPECGRKLYRAYRHHK